MLVIILGWRKYVKHKFDNTFISDDRLKKLENIMYNLHTIHISKQYDASTIVNFLIHQYK